MKEIPVGEVSLLEKGESGNPKGRPPERRSLVAALSVVLRENVGAAAGGAEPEMTTLEAATRQRVDKTVNGNPRVLQKLLNQFRKDDAGARTRNVLPPLPD